MFKLIKIFNSGANVPEPCRMYTSTGVEYRIGSALILNQGKLVNATETDKPQYIAGECAAAGQKKTIICYPVFENMLFEVPLAGTPTSIKPGYKVILATTDGFADMVGVNTDGGVATIVDTRGASKPGDNVFVKFD